MRPTRSPGRELGNQGGQHSGDEGGRDCHDTQAARHGGLHPHGPGGEGDQDIEGDRARPISGNFPSREQAQQQAQLSEHGQGGGARPDRRWLRPRRNSHAEEKADNETREGHDCADRSRQLLLTDRDAEKDQVSGDVGGEHAPETQIAHGVDAARGSGERQEERVTNSRSQPAAGVRRPAAARRCVGAAPARRPTSEA